MKGILDKLENGTIVTAENGFIYYANTAVLNQLRMKREQIEGKNLNEFLEEIKYPQGDTVNYYTCLKNQGSYGKQIKLEVLEDDWKGKRAYFYLFEEGSEKSLEEALDDLPACIKEELMEKAAAEEELKCLLNTAVDLTVIIDRDYKIKKVNQDWESLLGWQNDELINRKIKVFIHPEDLKKVFDYNGSLNKEVTVRMACKDGSYKWFMCHVNDRFSEQMIACTAKDISLKKETEDMRAVYKEQIEIEKIRSEFFANVSHEFRTPINIILASIQLLENKKNTAEDKIEKYSAKIRQNAFRLLKLSNNLIDLTKMDIGAESVKLEDCDIVSIVEQVTQSVIAYAENSGLEIIFDTEIEELVMACDIDKIERIVLNLLSNAVKFTPRNGKIKVNMHERNRKVIITVEDTGIGIPKEKCSMIFERFTQVDTSLRRRCEGSGMGLAVVKSIVDMCDGNIGVNSMVGQGTVFTVELPVYRTEDQKILDLAVREEQIKNQKCNIEFSDIYSC